VRVVFNGTVTRHLFGCLVLWRMFLNVQSTASTKRASRSKKCIMGKRDNRYALKAIWDAVAKRDQNSNSYERDMEEWDKILSEKGIDVESREGKVERIYLKQKEKEMHTETTEEIMACMLKENPTRWLEVNSKQLDQMIVDYNNVAFEQGLDVIMAFKMTPEEYAAATKEALDGLIEDKDEV
jgi:hypothetical protein